mmetsp:Transcript_70027/g.198475  ORF Transcript_70027/g.198475 Transcript_70027/m.198475 type:complete len:174 (-) Transcript_70027:223-744(-)
MTRRPMNWSQGPLPKSISSELRVVDQVWLLQFVLGLLDPLETDAGDTGDTGNDAGMHSAASQKGSNIISDELSKVLNPAESCSSSPSTVLGVCSCEQLKPTVRRDPVDITSPGLVDASFEETAATLAEKKLPVATSPGTSFSAALEGPAADWCMATGDISSCLPGSGATLVCG